MRRLIAIRLSLALVALVVFALGIRNESNYLRMTGIILLAAALILRFVGGRMPGV